MNGPRVMCNGCAAVEVPLTQPFCEHCSDQVMQQLGEPVPPTKEDAPARIQVGPTDI